MRALSSVDFIKQEEYDERFSYNFEGMKDDHQLVLVESAKLVPIASELSLGTTGGGSCGASSSSSNTKLACQLTPARNSQRGAVWHASRCAVDCGFFSCFAFQIRNGPSADGLYRYIHL